MEKEECNLRFLCSDPVLVIVIKLGEVDLQNFTTFTSILDPRVRAKAIRDLERMCMHNQGALTFDSYLTIRDLCNNSSLNVRLSALRILERLAQRYPEFTVKNVRGHEVRVHDDAFSVMCHALNDLEMFVRSEAVTLLGRFQLVSKHFLHQTLDKKLLAPMKIQNDGTQSTLHDGGSWSTGRKFGEAAPDIPDDDDESLAILPTNTCGAFVTALEDEFMAVRLPAVNSLCCLASNRPDFAFLAIDHLSDMFNDEMHEVRLASIQALTPLLAYVKLNLVQLDSILSVLLDASPNTRLALHELLARANLADSSCIQQVMKVLMISMQRFPRDRDSIFRCISQIGRRHSSLIHALVPELFQIHPTFESQEQDVNDDFYLAHLILAMNAAAVQEPIRPLVPKYAIKHYRYVRLAMPNLIPVIGEFERKLLTKPFLISDSSAGEILKREFESKSFLVEMETKNITFYSDRNSENLKESGLTDSECDSLKSDSTTLRASSKLNVDKQFRFIHQQISDTEKRLEFTYKQIFNAYVSADPNERLMLLKLIVDDLSNSENVIEERFSSPIRLLHQLCELLIAYDRCVRRQYNKEATILNVIEECLGLIVRLRHLFNGLHMRLFIFLAECELHLRTEYLFLKMQTEEPLSDELLLMQLKSVTDDFRRQLSELDAICSSETRTVVEWIVNFVQSHENRLQKIRAKSDKPIVVTSFCASESNLALQKLAECHLKILTELPNLRLCSTRSVRLTELCDSTNQPINYGSGGPESVYRFVAGLPTALRLHAHLHNVTEKQLHNFRVEIVYPDDLHVYQKPKRKQITIVNDHLCLLDTMLIVSAEHWAEPSDIRIRCGLLTEKGMQNPNFDSDEGWVKQSTEKAKSSAIWEDVEFVALLDADCLSRTNQLQLRIHPMSRC